MQKGSVDWDGLQTFERFIAHGSYSAAARALGLSHATISRRLERLEKQCGGVLFERRDGGVELTRIGALVLETARAMAEQTDAMARRAASGEADLRGTVRVAATEAMASVLLVPNATRLLAAWPGLELEFASAHASVSLARRDADIAVRYARPDGASLVAQHVGNLHYRICGTPVQMQAYRRDPAASRFVGYDDTVPPLPERDWLQAHVMPAQICLRSNSLLSQWQAVRAGVGLGIFPEYLICEGLEASAEVKLQREVWLVYHADLKKLPRLRVVKDWLQGVLAESLGVRVR